MKCWWYYNWIWAWKCLLFILNVDLRNWELGGAVGVSGGKYACPFSVIMFVGPVYFSFRIRPPGPDL
jgi:hypothetical protein